jgi:hypothetical protein
MKKVLLVLLALCAFGATTLAFADDETLPEIAPTDEVALPPIDAPAADDAS